MHLDKSHPASLNRSRPYQGVRVKDPVKELLRRKRSQEMLSTKTAPDTGDVITHNNQSTFTQGIFGNDVASCSLTKSPVCDGEMTQWRAPLPITRPGLQPTGSPWSSPDYSEQVTCAQPLAYPTGSTLTADVYMQTLCPSYTMLTYKQTPLLTNVGTIPVATSTCSLPQMDLQELGCAYIPWTQPLTTLSTMLSGVQLTPGSPTLSGSPLVHMSLSKTLTTTLPQLDTQGIDSQAQILEPVQYSDLTNPKQHDEVLDEGQPGELETPNLLDKILEDQGKEDESGDKVSYSNSLFASNGF
ncbi:POU domain class 2-associating factor 1 [Syngnathoides biaculeatus]|uniref:POU domain class 2-associating factor 1 n=1 Tax=Syngnathoides biaculeatus TaxID=300417 RepID=UPI002ADE29C1|nr:POU domain class 2-associating factor 1 [Syngnathoides biaculeatus]